MPNEDGSPSIDFGALRDKALALSDAADVTRAAAAPVVTPAVVTPPVVEVKAAEVEPDKVAAAVVPDVAPVSADPVLTSLADDALVEVTVDGEVVTMPWKDAKAGISRTSKFTKSMQTLAAERKAFDGEKAQLGALQNERQQLAQFLNNPQAVAAYLQQIAPQAVTPPAQVQQQDPNAVITVGEAQALAAAQSKQAFDAAVAAMQSAMASKDTQITDAIASLEHKQETAKHAVVINSTLKEIFTANPMLNGIPNAEDLIRYNVAMMNPQTEAEALDAFRQVAGGMVENISKHFTATKKVAAVTAAKEKLTTKTIEPAGGAAPQIAPASYKNSDGGVDWNKVRDMAQGAYAPLA